MDEELGGVNPNSFFEQLTEVRGTAETAQKTSNSNLSLLNELKEKVEIISNDLRLIKDKQFADEDRRQKEEMEAKVKKQNEKSQGTGGGDKGGSEGGTKGGGGGVMGFISSFIGGLVGGTVGLAIQGAGAIIGLGTGIIKKGADLGKSLMKGFSNLFGGKKNEKGGEVKPAVNPNSLMDLKLDDEEKDSKKLTTVREKGKVVGGNVSQEKSDLMKRQIDLEEEMSDAIEQGDMKRYEKLEKESEEIDKKLFNLEKSSEKSSQPEKKKDRRGILGMIGGGIDKLTGNLTDFDKRGGKTFGATRVATGMLDFATADMFDLDKRGKMDLFGMRKKMENKRKKEAFENNPRVKNFRNQTEKLKDQGKGFPVDTTVNPDGSITSKFGGIRVGGEPVVGDTLSLKQRMAIKAKIQMGNKIEGIEKELYEKSGGGNFSESEEKEIMKLYGPKEGEKDPFDYYGDNNSDNNSEDAFGFNQGGLVQGYNQGGKVDSVPAMLTPGEFVVTRDAVQKVGADTLKGLNASVGATNKPSLSSLEIGGVGDDYNPFEEKQMSVGGVDSAFTIDGEKQYLTPSQIKKQLTKMNVPYKELLNGMVIPDAAKMTANKMPEYYQKMKTVISETVPDEKMREKMVGELDKFMTKLAGGGDFRDTSQIEAEMNRYIPGTIENLGLQITESANKSKPKKKGLFSLGSQTQNFNQGGLVQPVIESKNESGEMELIQNLSQSVDSNRQTLMVMEEQNQVMNPPNQNPNPVALADTPQTAPAEIKDTEAPIPFAMLLRQNAQRYLNLGNDAMVIS